MATPAMTSGTATPMELDPEQAALSLKVSLADKSAKAAALYAHKNYDEAAEIYAQAAEMQAEMEGEMNPDNAEILFLYGRALFKVGQSKSDVLGGKAPDSKKPKAKSAAKKAKASNGNSAAPETKTEKTETETEKTETETEKTETETENGAAEVEAKVDEVVSQAAATEAAKKDDAPSALEKKPLFHFEGDENFEDSEDEDAEEGDGDEAEEEEDDLAVAFEILDLARVLFNKKLEAIAESKEPKDQESVQSDLPAIRHINERLADTHDLLAEISLENERYPNAITDSRASLKYKKELFPQESEIIAEAHFKLSLALEFASVTKSSDDKGDSQIDQALRDEAATELEAAIASTKLKLQNQEVELATLHNPEDNDLTRKQITEIKEVIADMEQRLVELRKPPVDINAALGLPARPTEEKVEVEVPEEVKRNAHDLSGLVKRKRKAEDVEEADPGAAAVAAAAAGLSPKKLKEDDTVEEKVLEAQA
ncbi:hypothetical protein B0H66DRAFT_600508 [Apodospora peruviana]|uniref:Tetratricopeptide SHNi-TPR domain-containing protein n=1 Tax=Apodospora peruviana TaxID=516989 RepID=A0AAE0IKF3_9PEZI|nr:hypothetical protein B0H66DRAFT_600508 [Apodospora peruviana]